MTAHMSATNLRRGPPLMYLVITCISLQCTCTPRGDILTTYGKNLCKCVTCLEVSVQIPAFKQHLQSVLTLPTVSCSNDTILLQCADMNSPCLCLCGHGWTSVWMVCHPQLPPCGGSPLPRLPQSRAMALPAAAARAPLLATPAMAWAGSPPPPQNPTEAQHLPSRSQLSRPHSATHGSCLWLRHEGAPGCRPTGSAHRCGLFGPELCNSRGGSLISP